MIKLNKEKSGKICALFLSASLALPLIGCKEEKYENEMYNYNGTTIVDNNGAHLYLTKEMNEDIMNCDDEFVTIPFGENKLTFKVSELKKNLAREKQKKVTSNMFGGILFFSILGYLACAINKLNNEELINSKIKEKKK